MLGHASPQQPSRFTSDRSALRQVTDLEVKSRGADHDLGVPVSRRQAL